MQLHPMREKCTVVLLSMAMGVAACALLDKYDYDRIDYLADIRRCQCTKVPNPFYVDGAVAEEV